MALKELTALDIREAIEFIRSLETQVIEDWDGNDYLTYQTEIQALETHTGQSIQQLMEQYNV